MTYQTHRFISFSKLIPALLVATSALMSPSAAQAQSTMTIDGNCSFTLSTSTTTPAVQVNPATGNVTVNSQTGVNCSPASATLTVPSTVNTGAPFQVSWTSTGTSSCNMSGGTAGWAGTGRGVSGTLPLTAPATAQTVAFNLSCVTGGTPATDSKSITFQGGTASVSLTAQSPVPVNQLFSVSWMSTGTVSCTPTGGAGTTWASQSIGTTGNLSLTAPANPGNVNFGITCNTGSGTVSDTDTVTFTAPTDCSGVTLPPGVNGFAQRVWSTEYGAQFPLNFSTNRSFNVNRGQGLRIAITPTIPAGPNVNGTLTYNEENSVPRQGYMSISRCPGDFRLNVLNVPAGCDGVLVPCQQQCMNDTPGGQLAIKFRIQGTDTNACNMTPGLQYYVNIHFGGTSTPGPDGAFCGGPICSIIGGTQALFLRETAALRWLEGDMLGLTDPAPEMISVPLESLTITPDP